MKAKTIKMKRALLFLSLLTTCAYAAPTPTLRQELYSMCTSAVAQKDPSPIVRKMSRSNGYVSGNTHIEWAFLLRNGDKCNCDGYYSLMGRHSIGGNDNDPSEHEWVDAVCGGLDYELSPNSTGEQGGSLLPIGGAHRPCHGIWRGTGVCLPH